MATAAHSCGNGDDATAAAVGIDAYLHVRSTSVTGTLKQQYVHLPPSLLSIDNNTIRV